MNHNRDIDYNIWAIQRSTRTSFKSFVKLHNYLRTKSKFYYFWHANKLSSVMHQTILALFVMGVTYYTFNSYQQYVLAANKSKNTAQDVKTLEQRTVQNQLNPISEDILSQISQITASQAMSAFSSELNEIFATSDKQIFLSVQEEIKQAVAKDSSLLELIKILESGGKLQSEQMSSLITALSKIGQDSVLNIISNNLSLTNVQLEEIEKRLQSTLKVAVTNESDTTAISNFPQDYPSSSIVSGQEDIGGNVFNRSQNFEQWALKHNYYKYIMSKEIAIPDSGEDIQALTLTAPKDHTIYLSDLTISSQSNKYSIIEIGYRENSSAEIIPINKVFVDGIKSEKFAQQIKLVSDSSLLVVVKGINKPNGIVIVSATYIDLPWEE